jgi:hypothetical protein
MGGVAGAGMNSESWWLVHNDKIVVLKNYRHRNVLGDRWCAGGGGGKREGDPVTVFELETRPGRFIIDSDEALLDQSLKMGPGETLALLSQKSVQPSSGVR